MPTGLIVDFHAGRLGPASDFRVVWPTVEEVKGSVEGWFAGVSIPGASLGNVFHLCTAAPTGVWQPCLEVCSIHLHANEMSFLM